MKRSIHRHLLLWVLGTLSLGAALLVGGSYAVLRHEMGEVFEDNLKQVALAVAHHQGAAATAAPARLAQQLPRAYEEYGTFEFVTAVWTRDGRRLLGSDDSVPLPFLSRSGLSEVSVGGERWHLYTIVLEDGIVQAAQRAREREALARETASTLIVPALVLLALVSGLMTLAIALAVQRHFLADAAHELRTPITALRLQLQLLERAPDETARREATERLRTGVERSQHLAEQLLQLSRLAPETPALRLQAVNLADLARTAVAQFSARAEQKRVDLGAVGNAPVLVQGDPHQLLILLNNLIENALRHTPPDGRVDVAARWEGSCPVLVVVGDGPGIPAGERGRVFDRLYRVAERPGDATGSGLGLAIVRAVAERHGAQVTLDDAGPGTGLRVTVRFG